MAAVRKRHTGNPGLVRHLFLQHGSGSGREKKHHPGGRIPGEACKAGGAVKRLIGEMWNVSVEKAGNPPAGYDAAEPETGMPSGTGRGLCPGTPVENGENRQRESRSIRQTDRRRDEPSGVSVSGKNRSMQRQNGKGRRNPATRDAAVIHVPT
jgi:hypothetical protein